MEIDKHSPKNRPKTVPNELSAPNWLKMRPGPALGGSRARFWFDFEGFGRDFGRSFGPRPKLVPGLRAPRHKSQWGQTTGLPSLGRAKQKTYFSFTRKNLVHRPPLSQDVCRSLATQIRPTSLTLMVNIRARIGNIETAYVDQKRHNI